MNPIEIFGALSPEQWAALARQAEREGEHDTDFFVLDILRAEADRILQAEALERYDEPSPPYRPRLLGL